MKINVERLNELFQQADNQIEKLELTVESELIKHYQKALIEIKSDISALYEKYGDDVTYQEMVTYNRLTNLEIQIAKIIKSLNGRLIGTTEKGLNDIYSESFKLSTAGMQQAGAAVSFGQLRASDIEAVIVNSLDRIKWQDRLKEQSEILLRQIKEELATGLIQGKGYAKIARTMNERSGIGAYKSLRIMRTEGHRAQSAGRLLAYDEAKKQGLQIKKKWLSTKDSRTRDSHKAMDGQIENEEGLFVFPSGLTTAGPGLSGIAEEDIHCRCTIIAFDPLLI